MKATQQPMEPLLAVRDLVVDFGRGAAAVRAVNKASFTVGQGEFYCLVGESGAGKSVTALSIARLLRAADVLYAGGEILLLGQDTLRMDDAALRRIRGETVSYIFQEPLLNPAYTVGELIVDALRRHRPGKATENEVVQLLTRVGIPQPEKRCSWRPAEFSGGQQQRIMLAIALAAGPRLLIADEATVALDPTIQAEIMELLLDVQRERGMGILFITHNLGLATYADRAGVMHRGEVVEEADVATLLASPKHPYTRQLFSAIPRMVSTANQQPRPAVAEPVLVVEHLHVIYQRHTGFMNLRSESFHAVRDVSFEVHAGEALGLVGESGAGKSSIARAVTRLLKPASGRIRVRSDDITHLEGEALRKLRRNFQIIFQDAFFSLAPTATAAEIISEALDAHNLAPAGERSGRIEELINLVGLSPEFQGRRRSELSGGQRRRLGIARALAVEPKLIVIDELGSLDLPAQVRIVALLQDLQKRFGMSYLLISHDLPLVAQLCHRVIVLRSGEVVETGETHAVIDHPRNPYTRSLIEAVPELSRGTQLGRS